MDILFIVTVLLLILCVVGLYSKSKHGVCSSKKRLDGKTCLVTGGTSGIGLEVAIDLAMRGARVIVACPFRLEGETAKQKIIEQSENKNVVYKFLDLASFDSVRKFAANIVNEEERLDILMNNAGVGIPDQVTEDGLNMTMQVNYLGHFLLTILLLPLLKKTGSPSSPSRIVNTSSFMHRLALLNTHELGDHKAFYFSRIILYCNSKLSLLLFSRELTSRLAGSNVVINDADPGEVSTRIYMSAGVLLGVFPFLYCYLFAKTPLAGAQTLLHAALDNRAGTVSSKYFRNCEMRMPASKACDDHMARSLWEESVKCVKFNQTELKECLK